MIIYWYVLFIKFTTSIFRLKQIDIIVLKKLVEVVNVVPVIAKADTLTLEERAAFKQRVSLIYNRKQKQKK
jgi:septin family protein